MFILSQEGGGILLTPGPNRVEIDMSHRDNMCAGPSAWHPPLPNAVNPPPCPLQPKIPVGSGAFCAIFSTADMTECLCVLHAPAAIIDHKNRTAASYIGA